PAAETDDPPAEVGDRKDDAVAEAVEGDRDVVARDEEAGGDHLVLADSLAGEMLLQGRAVRRRIADAEAPLQLGRKPAIMEIAARLGAGPLLQRRLEEGRGEVEHVVERGALPVATL